MNDRLTSDGLSVPIMAGGNDHYVWLYDEAGRAAISRLLSRITPNMEFDLTWEDAAMLRQRMQEAALVSSR